MSSRNVRLTGWRLAGVVAATTFVVAGAAVGAAGAPVTPYTVPLDPSTPTPIAAATFSHTGSCAGIVPPNLDGWHFAVTDGVTEIVGLTLTFNSPIGALGIVYTSDRQQAYVATLPGVQLTQASALVTTPAGTPQVQSFELANTCPTQAPFGLSTASPSPFPRSVLPTGMDTPIPASLQVTNTNPASPSATATRSASPTCSPTPTASATTTPTPTASATPSRSASATPTATPTASASATPTATPTPTPTASASATPTPTRSASATPTTSVSAAPTCSPTAAGSPTASPTSSTGAAPTPTPVASSLPVTG